MKLLNNVRVSIRLPIAVLLAVIALIVFAVTALTTLSTVKVGGPREQAVAEHNLLLADILPPPAYLVETDRSVAKLRQAVDAGDAAAQAGHRAAITANLAAFTDRQSFWRDNLEPSNELTAMQAVETTGRADIDSLESTMLPAIDAGDDIAIGNAQIELDSLFATHREAVDAAALLIGQQTTLMTNDATNLANGREQMLWILLVLTVIVVGAAATIVTLSVVKPLGELKSNMDDIASGDGSSADRRLDADRRDEFGQVAESFNTFADKLVSYSGEVERNAVASRSTSATRHRRRERRRREHEHRCRGHHRVVSRRVGNRPLGR